MRNVRPPPAHDQVNSNPVRAQALCPHPLHSESLRENTEAPESLFHPAALCTLVGDQSQASGAQRPCLETNAHPVPPGFLSSRERAQAEAGAGLQE